MTISKKAQNDLQRYNKLRNIATKIGQKQHKTFKICLKTYFYSCTLARNVVILHSGIFGLDRAFS